MGKQVYKAWLETVRQQGSRTAVRETDGNEVSFNELQDRINNRLNLLTNGANWRHRVVSFQLENSASWFEAFLTCQALEAIALPFDMDVPWEGLESALSVIRPAAFWNSRGVEPLKNQATRSPACLIKLTSGTTGVPRPLFFEDAQMLADGNHVCKTMGIHSSDTNLAMIPFGHSYGLGNLVMPMIQLGTPVAICQEPYPHSISRTIREASVTVVPAVPAILNSMACSSVTREEVECVRVWISAGSPLSADVAHRFLDAFGALIHNFYGSSETGGIAYDQMGQETLSGRSVGTPLDGVSVCLTGSGRLQVTSKAVFTRGNRRHSGRQGVHVLADQASLLENGQISIKGRRTRMVKIDGKRVNLGEVESKILEIDGVDGARVTDFMTPQGRVQLAAAIYPDVPSKRIRHFLKSSLPAWKIPDKYLVLSQFPLTSRGKVNFRKLDRLLRA